MHASYETCQCRNADKVVGETLLN